jgi:hypothetical protein
MGGEIEQMADREQKIQWSTRGMLVRHHTLMRRLAADKRTTMEEVHNRALEIGLGVIEREVFEQLVSEEVGG